MFATELDRATVWRTRIKLGRIRADGTLRVALRLGGSGRIRFEPRHGEPDDGPEALAFEDDLAALVLIHGQ